MDVRSERDKTVPERRFDRFTADGLISSIAVILAAVVWDHALSKAALTAVMVAVLRLLASIWRAGE